MRKLLIKLLAIETALVGWLSYWLFLVYANNPTVSAELSSSLQKFPQLSFSTIDIAVMVIIAALAATLAFKFQRGLRPGIRLERALQMLENLMKRNLVLEAQVAEFKIEKTHTPPPMSNTPITSNAVNEPRPGSWEKAFRTPLEAGPSISQKTPPTKTDDIPFSRESGVPPPRIEAKFPQTPQMIRPPIVIPDSAPEKILAPSPLIPDKPADRIEIPKPSRPSASSWEDNPQTIGETKGILTPSSTRKAPTVSDSGGLRQPYIPAPAPRPAPPSVVVGQMPSTSIPRVSSPAVVPRITARPSTRTSAQKTVAPPAILTSSPEAEKPEGIQPVFSPPLPTTLPVTPSPADESPKREDESTLKSNDETSKTDEKTVSKSIQPTRKRATSSELS